MTEETLIITDKGISLQRPSPKIELVPYTSNFLKEKAPPFDFQKTDAIRIGNILAEYVRHNDNSLGLSACQLGINERVFVIKVSPEQIIAYFNPEIVSTSKEESLVEEGCLSFPNLFLKVTRPKEVTVRYQDYTGKWRDASYTGITARVFQHEFQHLEGKTFLNGCSRLKIEKAIKKAKISGITYNLKEVLAYVCR